MTTFDEMGVEGTHATPLWWRWEASTPFSVLSLQNPAWKVMLMWRGHGVRQKQRRQMMPFLSLYQISDTEHRVLEIVKEI